MGTITMTPVSQRWLTILLHVVEASNGVLQSRQLLSFAMWVCGAKNISVRQWCGLQQRSPLTGRSGILKVIEPGLLVFLMVLTVLYGQLPLSRSVQNSTAQLLDSGNLIVKEAVDDTGNFLWQSFDHPTDTLLPGMKLGWNFVTGREVYLSSWQNKEDPAPTGASYLPSRRFPSQRRRLYCRQSSPAAGSRPQPRNFLSLLSRTADGSAHISIFIMNFGY
ncbi:hypothetical protein HAX54_007479 [Datura stramonium]|uniref:Bulb-type lectin domain-containing protein n=1 Tax=Datura stramonium TaxID=4076 RepID=A0ABS8TDE8_DATST|nr:hypothetical protein [Datura stramonium]